MQIFLYLCIVKVKNLHIVLSILLAVVLLVSGFAKAADAAYFSNIIYNTFHLSWLAFLAPALILVEIALGLLLLMQWRQRWVAIATGAMLIAVTIIYIIGVTGFGMTNCGCFGHLRWLNLPPAGTIIRNLAMLGVCVLLTQTQTKTKTKTICWWVLPIALTIAAFMSGYTMRGATVLWARSQVWQGVTIEESPLKDLGLSQDSSYLVFTFSFNCPFCQMAVGNVSLYESSGTVDRVVALAIEDSLAEHHFLDCYITPPFAYRTLPEKEMHQLVSDLPTTFFISHDTIRYVWTGEVPPAIFIK